MVAGVLLFISPVRAQIQRIASPDSLDGNHFGASVAYDQSRILVGASGEASCGENAGAAYIFEEGADSRFTQVARIAPANCKSGRFFGHLVALSGSRALVAGTRHFLGGEQPNPVYVFEEVAPGKWQESARLIPDSEESAIGFGASISLDGNRALVTSVGDPSAGIQGSVFIYEADDSGQWGLVGKIEQGGTFGDRAVLDGDRFAVSAPALGTMLSGGIFVYERNEHTAAWEEAARLGGFNDTRLRFDLEGDRLVVGRSETERNQRGRTEIYVRGENGKWALEDQVYPISAYDFGSFGTDVSISGSRLLIVGFTEQINLPFNIDRVVYVFRQNPNGGWRQQHIIDVGNTGFGASLDVSGQTALIGEASDQEPGAAYIVRLF